MSLPIVVTHPSTLFHNGLRQLFAKSRFRPVRIATALTEDLESYLGSVDGCVWLTGVEKGIATTNALVRKAVSANPRIKAVILAPTQKPEDIVAALRAGACGYLCQDLPGETLLRSVELIAHGEMIVHPQLAWSQTPSADEFSALDVTDSAAYVTTNGKPQLAQRFRPRSPLTRVDVEVANENQTGDVPSLSRREMLILRMLMQGASNKVIARNLVITESTVKVHMKAILRKLRLQNRTQAAIWARNNVNEADWNNRAAAGSSSH
jgi:two-component system nitrate/nitrite response regulator NarL